MYVGIDDTPDARVSVLRASARTLPLADDVDLEMVVGCQVVAVPVLMPGIAAAARPVGCGSIVADIARGTVSNRAVHRRYRM